jgi:hypothetical protein
VYWFSENDFSSKGRNNPVHLLPAFDEFLISYKERTAALPARHNARAVTNNGIFRQVIVVNGQVEGIWKRGIIKDKVIFEPEYFSPPDKAVKKSIDEAFARYAAFIEKETE